MPAITNTSRGWATVRWTEAEDADARFMQALLDLGAMPGPRVYLDGQRMAEVPGSVWSTEAWRAVASRGGWFPPRFGRAADWSPSRPLYAHQREGVTFLVDAGGGLCADQMGLGKTSTAIVAAERLARSESPDAARLVIAPGFTRDVWQRELLALGAIRSPEEFCAVRTRNPLDSSFKPKQAHWWFVHYDVAEAWASRLVTNARGRPIVAIVDEAHWIKNGMAQRSKGAAAVAGVAASRILLTGTPIANRPSELWHLLTVLDGSRSWGSPVEFRQRYCGAYYDGYGWKDGLYPTCTTELAERLKRRYLRRTIDDAGIELPALSRQVLSCEMDAHSLGEQVSILDDAGGMAAILSALDRGAFGRDVLRALARLAKLTSSAKLATTRQYLLGLMEQGEAAVVFTHERATARKIATLLGDDQDYGGAANAFVATGEDDQAVRDDYVARFQAGERKVMVTTYGAMREGVTLHRARHVVLHDLAWRPSDVLQAEARVHRIGQRRGCTSTWVMAQDSFDTLLARMLLSKGANIAASIGDASAASAATEIGLEAWTGASVEDEARRLIDAWTI